MYNAGGLTNSGVAGGGTAATLALTGSDPFPALALSAVLLTLGGVLMVRRYWVRRVYGANRMQKSTAAA